MLKVNSEKLLGEIARLQGEIADNDLHAFNEAKAIGEQRGWSDVLISAFADILLKEEAAFDISAKKKTLDYLMLFVEEVADEPVEEEVVPAPAPVEEVAPEVVEQPVVFEVESRHQSASGAIWMKSMRVSGRPCGRRAGIRT